MEEENDKLILREKLNLRFTQSIQYETASEQLDICV